MSTSRRPSTWEWILAQVVVVAVSSLGASDQSILVWSGPMQTVTGGEHLEVSVTCLNDSSRALRQEFAQHLTAQLTGSQGYKEPVALELQTGSGPAVAVIPPKSFARRAYGLTLPSTGSGRLVLEIPSPQAGRLVLEVQPERAVAEPAASPKAPETVTEAAPRQDVNGEESVGFFKRHLFPYEPFYFIAGTESPNAKFQISLKYRLFDPQAGLARKAPPVADIYLGYTQTSIWDWEAPSAPFVDTSYKPEVMFFHPRVWMGAADDWFRLDVQGGLQHESNGRDGEDSRSMNFIYIKPSLIFGYAHSFQFSLAPRAWFYVWDLSDNPDIADYRGHADLVARLGWEDSLLLRATLRGGDDFDHGSLELDLSYPLRRIPWLGLTWYVYVQYFTGYGESFLHYRERSDALRFGISLYR